MKFCFQLFKHLTLASFALLFSENGHAWSNHSVLTHIALKNFKETNDLSKVKVESLEHFLQSVIALKNSNDGLEKDFDRTSADLHKSFVRAYKINPNCKLNLFQQATSPQEVRALAQNHRVMDKSEYTTVSSVDISFKVFELKEDEMVRPVDVFATAADEPDFGLDIGLFNDNNTVYGKQYGFGAQPFGNPGLEFSSQAPFHMAFYHESFIVNKFASFLAKTHLKERVGKYLILSNMAFQQGHPYWGWRFAGWALHYLQDLTQPYHSTVLPGVSTVKMLGTQIADLFGHPERKENQIQLVSNRHIALENFQFHHLKTAVEQNNNSDPVITALSEIKFPVMRFQEAEIKGAISIESHGRANAADAIIAKNLPANFVSDPKFEFGNVDATTNIDQLLGADKKRPMLKLLQDCLSQSGRVTRSLVMALKYQQPKAQKK
jgi:hypothetical protein